MCHSLSTNWHEWKECVFRRLEFLLQDPSNIGCSFGKVIYLGPPRLQDGPKARLAILLQALLS